MQPLPNHERFLNTICEKMLSKSNITQTNTSLYAERFQSRRADNIVLTTKSLKKTLPPLLPYNWLNTICPVMGQYSNELV